MNALMNWPAAAFHQTRNKKAGAKTNLSPLLNPKFAKP